MIINFAPDQMAKLRTLCNEFNRTTGLQLTVNDYLTLVVTSFMNGVRNTSRPVSHAINSDFSRFSKED